MGFGAIVTFDFNQEQQENFILTVENAASIERLGVIAEQMSGALEGVWDDPTAAEHAVLLWKKKISSIPPRSTALLSVGTISATDAELTYSSDRDAANEAMATLVAIAKTRIAAAHRRHSVSASVPANPLIDLALTLRPDRQSPISRWQFRRSPALAIRTRTTIRSLLLERKAAPARRSVPWILRGTGCWGRTT